MTMYAGVRTPEEVIAIPLEDRGHEDSSVIAHEIAALLAVALKPFKKVTEEVVIQLGKDGEIAWATIYHNK